MDAIVEGSSTDELAKLQDGRRQRIAAYKELKARLSRPPVPIAELPPVKIIPIKDGKQEQLKKPAKAKPLQPILDPAGWPPLRVWLTLAHNEILLTEPSPRAFRAKEIQKIVAQQYGISVVDMLSRRRHASVATCRQIAMYLVRLVTDATTAQIGRLFGNRDHSTTLHGLKKIGRLIANDPQFANEIKVLLGKINHDTY